MVGIRRWFASLRDSVGRALPKMRATRYTLKHWHGPLWFAAGATERDTMIDDQINDVRIDADERLMSGKTVEYDIDDAREEVRRTMSDIESYSDRSVDVRGGLSAALRCAINCLDALERLRHLREDLKCCIDREEAVTWRVNGKMACGNFVASSAQEAASEYVEKYEPAAVGEKFECRPLYLPDREWEVVTVYPGKAEDSP